MRDALDWTGAHIADLDIHRHTNRAEEMAARLSQETSAGDLPFLTMPYVRELKEQLAKLKTKLQDYDHMLLLGIGGSALGARALQQAFFPEQDMPGHQGPWLWIADNVDPSTLDTYMKRLPPEKTVVVTVSKSGGTIETVGQYFIIRDWMRTVLEDRWTENMIFVTGESGFLRNESEAHGITTLPVPENLGGRYSVLSAVGLIPALFLGIDTDALLDGAMEVTLPLASPDISKEALESHESFRIACWGAALMDSGFAELIFFAYIPLWASFGDWFAQLWAESLGKQGKGSQPIPAVGVTDQHSVNQMFLDGPRNKACLFLTCPGLPEGPKFPSDLPGAFGYVEGKNFGELIRAEGLGTMMALQKTGVPLVELQLANHSPRQAGKMIALLGAATILTGWLMDINPLDQPAVELGKRLAKARLGADGLEPEKKDLEAFLSAGREIREF